MSTDTKSKVWTAGVVAATSTILITVGMTIGEVKAHAQRLDRVETKCEALVDLKTTMARIEAKLDAHLENDRVLRSQKP